MVRRRLTSVLLGLIAVLPAIALGYLILQNWVNVPLFDEWDTPGRLLKEVLVEGRFSWSSVFAQHNESRMVFPKLLWLASAASFGWDTKFGQALSWIAAVATWACWARLTCRASFSPLRRSIVLLLMALVFFSTNQWENWLWAFQLTTFIPGLCLSACLVVQQSSTNYRRKVVLCALLSLISTYSNANGMVCWILGWPYPRGNSRPGTEALSPSRGSVIRSTIAYAIVMCLSLAFYFYGYHTPANHPPAGYGLAHPGQTLHYFLAWIGNPIARGFGQNPLKMATIAGLLALGVFAILLGCIWMRRRSLLSKGQWTAVYPWIVISLYGFASGLITAVGRAGLGLEQAISTRYITFACYIFVGLVGMAAFAFRDRDEKSAAGSWLRPAAEAALAIVFISFVVADWRESLPAFQSHRRTEEQLRLTLRFAPLIADDPLLSGLYPDRATVRQLALPLLSHRVLRQQPIGSWLPAKLQTPDGEDGGAFDLIKDGNVTRIQGHSAVPKDRRWPDCIVVAAAEADNARLVTAIVLPKPGDSSGPHRDFAADLPAGMLPGIDSIRAYSADLDHHQVFSLTRLQKAALRSVSDIEDESLPQRDGMIAGNVVLLRRSVDIQDETDVETIQQFRPKR